jgi:hypothetical protein
MCRGNRSYICWRYSRRGGDRRIDGMGRGRRRNVGGILGEEGIYRRIDGMKRRGEEGATVCWRYSRRRVKGD